MSDKDIVKLLPRNVAALRRGQTEKDGATLVVGNPVSVRLESGVGNCFPGLECDLRNLERRFFPFLTVDVIGSLIRVASVDTAGVQAAAAAGQLSAAAVAVYQQLAADLTANPPWLIIQIRGTFGPLGVLDVTVANLQVPSTGANRLPPDAWTAVRLLTEGTEVLITLRRNNLTRTLTGNRARYLDDNGALAKMFLPGELTQSLCSPWTHDFRDCGCFYWASNHPDIALPPLPTPTPDVAAVNTSVPWQRAERTLTDFPPAPATPNGGSREMAYYEINTTWQSLNFVAEGREFSGPYEPGKFKGDKFPTRAELVTNLRYAAGVELAVIHEYLTAAYSLRVTGLSGALGRNVTAARAELIRVAASEMRHLRAVNDVLLTLARADNVPTADFIPALRVAARIPDSQPGTFRDVLARPATPQAIQDFIELERPSVSVDGLYSRILATLEDEQNNEMSQTIRSIMAEGENHFETFEFIQEWLGQHSPNQYLLALDLAPPPADNPLHATLQQRYRALLERLFAGYKLGIPAGAVNINAARQAMLGNGGLEGAAAAVAAAGFLVVFDRVNDPRFEPVNNP
ncbi:MAG TPA: ferritin-like domain-containing protein [Pyrinomonadaceae bacterium]